MTWTTRAVLAVAASLSLVACQTPSGSTGAAAPSADWQEVVKSDTQDVFVDVSSLQRNGDVVQASTKSNFASPMMSAKNQPYLSANNVYRLDCAQRKVALKSIKAYANADLTGPVAQSANFYDNNLQWMDAPTDSVFAHLLDFACKR